MTMFESEPEEQPEEKPENESRPLGEPRLDIQEKFLKTRTILIFGEINQKMAERVTQQLLLLSELSDEDIKIIINSQGGHVESGDTIHDMIRFVRPRVRMIGTGWVASAGALIYISVPREDRPPVAPVFYAFRVMVGLGVLMLLATLGALWAWRRGRLFDGRARLVLHGWRAMTFSGFVALLAGWYVTEIGRQPWVVYGLVRTAEAVTPTLAGGLTAVIERLA